MRNSTADVVYYWLDSLLYPHSRHSIDKLLSSHPDHPGITSITDTLDELHIENITAEIKKEALADLQKPFLAYVKSGHEQQFVVVQKKKNGLKVYGGEGNVTQMPVDAFLKLWTGIIIAADEYAGATYIRWHKYKNVLPLLLAELAFTGLFMATERSLLSWLHLILSMAGLLVCSFIIRKELGMQTALLDKFCTATASMNCEAVLNSKGARILGGVSLGDLGIVYFLTQLLVWISAAPGSQANAFFFLAWTGIIILPLTLISIYYQARVVKKWCPLCLSVAALLWLQAIVAFFYLTTAENSWAAYFSGMLPILMTASLVAPGWYFIKPLLVKEARLAGTEIESLAFSRNYHLFMPWYNQSEVINTTIKETTDIVLHNPEGSIKIILVSNPLCNSCREVHLLLDQIAKVKKEISVVLRFYVPVNNLKDKRTLIAAKLLDLYHENNTTGRKAIDEWYAHQDIDRLYHTYGHQHSKKALGVLTAHRSWCLANDIYTTPGIVVNKKKFPLFYNPTDLQYFLDALIAAQYLHEPEDESRSSLEEPSTMLLID